MYGNMKVNPQYKLHFVNSVCPPLTGPVFQLLREPGRSFHRPDAWPRVDPSLNSLLFSD